MADLVGNTGLPLVVLLMVVVVGVVSAVWGAIRSTWSP